MIVSLVCIQAVRFISNVYIHVHVYAYSSFAGHVHTQNKCVFSFTPALIIMSPSTHTTTTISSCLSAILLLVLILSSGCHSQTECSSCDDCSCQPDYSKCVNDLDGINIEGLSDPPNGHCRDSASKYIYCASMHIHVHCTCTCTMYMYMYMWLMLLL